MHRRTTATLLAATLVLAACGDDSEPTAETGQSPVTAAPTVEAVTYPVTVTAENGDVEVAAEPERIVSLSASLTEMLFAIDAGEQVVAVDDHSDFPDGTPVTDLSGFNPNVEAIGGYEPDLVVVSRDRDGLADALGALGIPVLVLSSADTIDDVYAQIELLGTATGHPAEAAELTADLDAELDELAATAAERDAPPISYFYELSDDLSTVTSDTFVGELLSLAGLTSIGDGVDSAAGGFPQLSNEYVISSDPEVIFLAHTDGTGDADEVAGRPGWAGLRAVQNGNVVLLDPDISSRWGPRITELLAAVVDATGELAG